MLDGAAERWLPVVGYEGIYEVSDLGRVKRIGRASGASPGFILKPYRKKDGYPCVYLGMNGHQEHTLVHRLVVSAFIGDIANGMQVNHRNGVKTDNRLENLEIVTPRENALHAYAIGLIPRGEKHHKAKLTTDAVREIRRLAGCGLTQREIAISFGVDRTNIGYIVRRATWSHVQ